MVESSLTHGPERSYHILCVYTDVYIHTHARNLLGAFRSTSFTNPSKDLPALRNNPAAQLGPMKQLRIPAVKFGGRGAEGSYLGSPHGCFCTLGLLFVGIWQ